MKIKQLVTSGQGQTDDKNQTFIFEEESTLGSALKFIISTYPGVKFCGYTVPHPGENAYLITINVNQGRAVDYLRRGLEDLANMSDHILQTFDEAVDTYRAANQLNV